MSHQDLSADYVIVGSGAAGSLLSRRLSRRNSVILLEAGPYEDENKDILNSELAPELEEKFGTELFWQLGETVPQEHVNNRTFHYGGGRLVGGSTSINGEQYVRPTQTKITEWQQLLHDSDYSPDNFNRIFKKLETYLGLTQNPEARGKHGPLSIRQTPQPGTGLGERFANAITLTTGIQKTIDYNDPCTPLSTFSQWQLYQKPNGSRASGSVSFLDPIIRPVGNDIYRGTKKHDLVLYTRATVLRILFKDGKAKGVSVLINGIEHVVRGKTIILAAGILSPIILLRSGVGPASDLKKLGIPVVVDNENVGKNLLNQTLLFLSGTSNPNDVGIPDTDTNTLYCGGALIPDPLVGGNRRGYQLIGLSPSPGAFNPIVIPLASTTAGEIKLYSSDPLTNPQINFNYLSTPEDLASLKAAVRLTNRILQNFGDPAYQLTSPTPEELADDDQLTEFIKNNLDQNHHWVGSVKMAPKFQGGVVDSSGRVYGVRNLLVADASVIPTSPDGNTSASVYAFASIIADKLLDR